ncbi:MAG TPA: hypothetical protein PKE45_07115, partial [Caldilineaceae bacterium]|nr:hypothetical protein [Caldilineaceae bacterium]
AIPRVLPAPATEIAANTIAAQLLDFPTHATVPIQKCARVDNPGRTWRDLFASNYTTAGDFLHLQPLEALSARVPVRPQLPILMLTPKPVEVEIVAGKHREQPSPGWLIAAKGI